MSPTGRSLLRQVFSQSLEIGQLVRLFDPQNMNIQDSKRESYVHNDVAPAYGNLNNSSMTRMDTELQIMIAGTIHVLKRLENKSWESVLATMMQNVMLVPDPEHITRADELAKVGINVFKFDGSPDASIVQEVQTWFINLIQDDDVMQSTRINIEVLARIVACTGAAVEDFLTIFAKNERHEKTVVDIGVLRFPDINNPFFKIYRIKLIAWSDCRRVLFVQGDANGIRGEYQCRTFRPRTEVIRQLSAKAQAKAIEIANSLFDD